ncbi:hypothetical protein GUITHDRAFT_55598, partial [Guillardia theta CCMP2712]
RGLKLPVMGTGVWAWGDEAIWNYGAQGGASVQSIEEALEVVVSSDLGFLDTAEVYGNGESERLVGSLLKKLPEEKRRKVRVATKFYPVVPSTNLPRGAQDLIPALDASLARLQLPNVDLYQIHGPGLQSSGEEIGEALAEAVISGRCKAVGVSNFAFEELLPVYRILEKRGIPLTSNQVEFSLLRRLPETGGLLEECRKLGISILAYSPLGMGRLTGKYGKDKKAPRSRFFGRVSDTKARWLLWIVQLEALLDRMREVGAAHGGKTPGQVALNWVMCKGAIPIPGCKNARQAQENAGALGWRLSDEEVHSLDLL